MEVQINTSSNEKNHTNSPKPVLLITIDINRDKGHGISVSDPEIKMMRGLGGWGRRGGPC